MLWRMVINSLFIMIKSWMVQLRPLARFYQRSVIKRFLITHNSVMLHIGCGNDYRDGYLNIDANPGKKADLIMTVEDMHLFPVGCVDKIESYHLFEHLHLYQARKALRDWFQILKPCGVLLIELPNFTVCVKEIGKHFDGEGIDLARAGINGYPPDVVREGVWQIHKWSWTPETLIHELEEAGFEQCMQYPMSQTWRPAASFGRDMQIRAVKPNTDKLQPKKL